ESLDDRAGAIFRTRLVQERGEVSTTLPRVASEIPEPAQGSGEPQPGLRVPRRLAPVQGRSQIVELTLQAVEPGGRARVLAHRITNLSYRNTPPQAPSL